jgi:hypothetical protein
MKTEKEILAAVKQNGDALQYVKDQTEAVCLEAVKQNSYALQYVKDYDLQVKIAKNLKLEVIQTW